jgi:hypothetical protein
MTPSKDQNAGWHALRYFEGRGELRLLHSGLYHRAQFGRTAESKSRMKSKIRKRSKSKIRIKIGT